VYGTISEIYALWQYKSAFNLQHLQTSGEQNPNNKSLIPTKKDNLEMAYAQNS
jgi:hypothetical protein